MDEFILIWEGLRMFRRSLKVRLNGLREYPGNAKDICKAIVEGCWNGTYFQVSMGNFNEFYCRDFGLCVDALLELGHKERIIKTLSYALENFRKHGRIAQSINPKGRPFELFRYSPDSLAFLIRSLNKAGCKYLIEEYKKFLNKEVNRFYQLVIDDETGLVKKENFSSMKDYSKRTSSCYDNVMVGMLDMNLNGTGLNNPFKHDYKKLIKENFWTGTHFLDDLSGKNIVTGDANVFPFWSGLFYEKDMLRKSIHAIQENKLDSPFPLRYYHKKIKEHDLVIIELLNKDYESDAIWMHLGQAYLDIVRTSDKTLFYDYIKKYVKLVERNKNYLEVFSSDGTAHKSPFYYTDDSMLWASMLLRYMK